jgi:TRAP-type C4-dicarboxylate transport system substrate-binding protein
MRMTTPHQPADLHDGAPRYRQILSHLKSEIACGRYLPGERLPTEKDISEQYAVSRHTARYVFQLLTNDGLVIRKQGTGTFVAPLQGKDAARHSVVNLRLGTIYPAQSFIVKCQNVFVRSLAELTRNQIHVEVIPTSEMGSDTEQLDMLCGGELDMFCTDTDWLEKLHPVYRTTNIPFLFRNLDHVRNFVKSPIAAELRKRVLGKSGVRILADNWLRSSRVLISKRPCMTLEDFYGLRLRVPPITTYRRYWEALGAIPIETRFRDIGRYLNDGELDAADVPRDSILDAGLHRWAGYITHTRHLYSRACLLICEASFRSLRKDLQDALRQLSEEAGRDYSRKTLQNWSEDKSKMIREGAVFIQTNMEPFRRRVKPLTPSILGARSHAFKMYREIFEMD